VSEEKNIGLFGGTFNPPHIGHLRLAMAAKKEFRLQKVFFIPSYLPPHKEPRNVLDASHRADMVKLLIEEDQDFVFSDYEIAQKTISYSIDTIKYFKNEFPDKKIFFLIGTDAFYLIDMWKDHEQILKLVDFIIFPREYYTKEMIVKKYGNMANVIYWAHTDLIHISSSNLRVKIRNGEGCTAELGEKVCKYIKENSLYR